MHTYQKAKKVADRIVEILHPHCALIHIAGSVRREKSEVKDIEIVCMPTLHFTPTDLFGGGKWKRAEGFKTGVQRMTKTVVKGMLDGRYMQCLLLNEIVMDLFMPQPHDYYRILAMRTGPADYSSEVIATGWVAKGWCGTDDGLRRIVQCTSTPSGWKCWHPKPELPPVWQSEAEFYAWLDLPFLEPKHRIVKQATTYRR